MRPPKVTIEMLTGEQAKSLATIAKENGARIQRLAQDKRELGRCKCLIHFDQYPGWADNAKAVRKFIDGDLLRWKIANKKQ